MTTNQERAAEVLDMAWDSSPDTAAQALADAGYLMPDLQAWDGRITIDPEVVPNLGLVREAGKVYIYAGHRMLTGVQSSELLPLALALLAAHATQEKK